MAFWRPWLAMGRKIAGMGAQDTASGEGARVSKPRTTYLQRALIVKLRTGAPDMTLATIAEQVGCSERTVARVVAGMLSDVKASTEALMATAVLERLDDWSKASRIAAKKGYHQPAKDFLEAAKAIEPKPTGASVTVAPTVVLNMPFSLGAVKPEPKSIDVQPVPLPEAKP